MSDAKNAEAAPGLGDDLVLVPALPLADDLALKPEQLAEDELS